MASDSSPTARALLALELIQGSPGISADRLADKLGITSRATRRYVGILREAGIPIESVRGPFGGYRLGRGLRLPPLVFTATEALGVVMAVLDGHHAASDPTDPVGSALGKIMRALPEPVAAQADAVRRATAAAPDRAAARPDPAITTALVAACSARQPLRLDYHSEFSAFTVDVDPWAIVVRHGRWYLLCHSHQAAALRAYRIDRIHAAVPTGLADSYSPPPDLNPVTLLEDHLARGWHYQVDITIHAPFAQVAPCYPRSLGRLTALDAQTTHLAATTDNPIWYAENLARIPAPYDINACPELQTAARTLGNRYLAAVEPP